MAQLVERSLPTPEVSGSNPVIGKFNIFFLSTVLKGRNRIKIGSFFRKEAKVICYEHGRRSETNRVNISIRILEVFRRFCCKI